MCSSSGLALYPQLAVYKVTSNISCPIYGARLMYLKPGKCFVLESGSLSLPELLIHHSACHPDLNSCVREPSLCLGSDSKILSQLLCPPSLLVLPASGGHMQHIQHILG